MANWQMRSKRLLSGGMAHLRAAHMSWRGWGLMLDKNFLRHVCLCLGFIIEVRPHAVNIESPLPPRDDDGCDAIPDEICQRAGLRHEAVDAEDQSDARDRDGADRGERGGQYDKARSRDTGRALGGEQQNPENAELLRKRQVGVCRLRQKQRRHRQINARTVEIERISGWNHKSDD